VPGQLRTATGLTAGFHGNTDLVTAPPTASWPVKTLVLQPDPRSVRAARVFIQTHCAAQLASDTCDTAVLLTSEVVTNALLHGRSQVRLAVRIDQTGLTVEVGDDNSQHPPGTTTADPGALGGRGLSILASLATCWGVRDEPLGKIVWFRISTDTQER